MKKIILIAIALIAMMGAATAEQINVYEPGTGAAVTNIPLVPGATTPIVKDLVVSACLGDGSSTPITHTIEYTAVPMAGSPTSATNNDIVVKFQETPSSSWINPGTWTQSGGVGDSAQLGISFSAIGTAPVGTSYLLTIKDSAGGTDFTGTLTLTSTTIPEFPTIALPVAAILGLAFIFQRRREED